MARKGALFTLLVGALMALTTPATAGYNPQGWMPGDVVPNHRQARPSYPGQTGEMLSYQCNPLGFTRHLLRGGRLVSIPPCPGESFRFSFGRSLIFRNFYQPPFPPGQEVVAVPDGPVYRIYLRDPVSGILTYTGINTSRTRPYFPPLYRPSPYLVPPYGGGYYYLPGYLVPYPYYSLYLPPFARYSFSADLNLGRANLNLHLWR